MISPRRPRILERAGSGIVGMIMRTTIRGMPTSNRLAPSGRTLVPRIGTAVDPAAVHLGSAVVTADLGRRMREDEAKS